jgi:hypothetical protein
VWCVGGVTVGANMMTKLSVTCAAFLLLVLDTAAAQRRAKCDVMDLVAPAVIGASIGASLASAVADAERFVNATVEGTAELQRLRKEFWRQYPNGPNFAKADAAFGRALFAKDLYYVPFYVMGGERNPTARPFLAFPVDGGIRPFAKPEYLAWIEEIREKIAEPGTSG